MTREASQLVTFSIPLLACIAAALVAFAIHTLPEDGPPRARRFLLGAAAWYAAALLLAGAGLLRDPNALPPPMLLIMIPALLMPTWLAWSKLGTALVRHLPLASLVGFHAFRLPLELVMRRAASEGTMPEQMSFAGQNFDILTGIAAIVVGLLAARGLASRALIFAFNLLGTVLLVVIGAIAISSLPAFHAFGTDPARLNTWVAEAPFVLLPAGLVASALFAHLLLWRRLAQDAARDGAALRFVNERQGAVDPN